MNRIRQLLVIPALMIFFLNSFGADILPVEPLSGHTYEFTEPQEITSLEQQAPAIKMLQDAVPGDKCIFTLQGIGGNANTMDEMIHLVRQSKCFVIMHVVGNVYSAHAYLAISGDSLIADKGTMLMFHTVQIMGLLPTNPIALHERQYFENRIYALFQGIFTDSEFKFMFANSKNEYYITGQEMMNRLERVRDHKPITPNEAVRIVPTIPGAWIMLVTTVGGDRLYLN